MLLLLKITHVLLNCLTEIRGILLTRPAGIACIQRAARADPVTTLRTLPQPFLGPALGFGERTAFTAPATFRIGRRSRLALAWIARHSGRAGLSGSACHFRSAGRSIRRRGGLALRRRQGLSGLPQRFRALRGQPFPQSGLRSGQLFHGGLGGT